MGIGWDGGGGYNGRVWRLFGGLGDSVMRRLRGEDVCKCLVLLWASWNYRNDHYHGDVQTEPLLIVEKALSFWEAWRMAQPVCGAGRQVRGEKVVWKPPVSGQWKVNVDAAVMGEARCGLGMVIRDHTGKVERTGVQQVRDMWCPEVAEAMAALFGLNTARQMGLDNVVLESDCMTLITMLKAKSFPTNYFGRGGKMVSDLASMFGCIHFNFTRRDGNVVAHELAHLVPLDYSTRYWVGTVPERVEPFVVMDTMLIPN